MKSRKRDQIMATTIKLRVGLALDILKLGLPHFVSREFIPRHKGSSRQVLERILSKAQVRGAVALMSTFSVN